MSSGFPPEADVPELDLRSAEARQIGLQLRYLTQDMRRLNDGVGRMGDSMLELVKLQASHTTVINQLAVTAADISDHEKRLHAIEVSMPGLVEMRRWVIMGILAGLGMMGAALLKLVLT